MPCSICGAEADLVLIRRGPEGPSEEALCEPCARRRGLRAGGGSIAIAFEEFLGPRNGTEQKSSSCECCGMDLVTLRKRGRLGCSRCVEVFRDEIGRRLSRRDESVLASPGPSISRPGADGRMDAIIRSHLRVGRMLPDLPLPGLKAGAHPASARAEAILDSLGLALRRIGELGIAERRNLSERALPPPSWLADDDSLLGWGGEDGPYCLIDCGDHLSLRMSRDGLALDEMRAELAALTQVLDEGGRVATDRDIGRLCASIDDLGHGEHAELLLHLPALERSGGLERVLRSVLGEGWSIEGRRGSGTRSSGAIWILSAGLGGETSPEALAEEGRRISAVEMASRRELADRRGAELLDSAGRALGLLSMAWALTVEEALDALSDLRLATLAGCVPALAKAPLAALLARLAASTEVEAAVPREKNPGAGAGRERARWLRSVFGLPEPFVMPGPVLNFPGGI